MIHRILAGLLSTALMAVLASADDKGWPPPVGERGKSPEHRKDGDKGKGPKDKAGKGGDRGKGGDDVKPPKGGKDEGG